MDSLPARSDTNKHRLLSLSKIISKEAAGAIVPMGGALFELIDYSIAWFKDKHFHESEARLVDFHRNLLKCDGSIEENEFLNKEFCEDDYYSMLKYVLNDEEKEKVEYYSLFFKALIKGNIPYEYKNFLLKGISKLSVTDIILLKKLYFSNLALRLAPFANKHCQNPFNSADAVTLSGLHSLKSLGLIAEKDNFFRLTKPSEVLVLSLFNNESILEGLDKISLPMQAVQFILASNDLISHKKIIDRMLSVFPPLNFSMFKDINALHPSDFMRPIVFIVDIDLSDLIEKNEIYKNEKSIIIYNNYRDDKIKSYKFPAEFYITEGEITTSDFNELSDEMSRQRARQLEESRKNIIAEAKAQLNELINKDRYGIGMT